MRGRLEMAFRGALVLALCLVWGCQQPPQYDRYRNEEYRFSMIFPKGWEFFEGPTDACLASAGAKKSDDCMIYVCARKPPKEFLSTDSSFVNCEQAKYYVIEQLKGAGVECRQGAINYRQTYDVVYMRRVQEGDATRSQFVSQTYLMYGGLLYMITAYAMGDTDAKAHALYRENANALLDSLATFFILRKPGDR